MIVDEKGTYIAEAGMPVGVDVRSGEEPVAEPEPEPELYDSSEGGDAGVTVAESHADWRIFADLFAVSGVFIREDIGGTGVGARPPGAGERVMRSASNVEVRRAELFIVEERSAEDLSAALRSVPVRGCFSEGRRICGVASGGLDHVVRMGEGCAL